MSALAPAPAAAAPTPVEEMPRLSAEMVFHGLTECHACGSEGTVRDPLALWQEHDEGDLPEHVYLVLCKRCADALVPPHPRLYARLARHQPAPGAMPICSNCAWQAGTWCWHPRSRLRGGPGVRLDGPDAQWMSIQLGGSRNRPRERRTSVLYVGPVWGCDSKQLTRNY